MLIGKVNKDFIAFDVTPNEAEITAEYLVAAMTAWCLITFGATPTELM